MSSYRRENWWTLTLSLPWVINFKFPLQSHQKYYISHYEEPEEWKMIILPILTASPYTCLFPRLGECIFWTNALYSVKNAEAFRDVEVNVQQQSNERYLANCWRVLLSVYYCCHNFVKRATAMALQEEITGTSEGFRAITLQGQAFTSDPPSKVVGPTSRNEM